MRRVSSASGTSARPEVPSAERGFDEFFGSSAAGTLLRRREHGHLPRHRAGQRVGLPDRRLRPRGGRVHRSSQGPPFFLEVAFNAVHTPMDATDARLARSHRSRQDPTHLRRHALGSTTPPARCSRSPRGGARRRHAVRLHQRQRRPHLPGTTINGSRNDPLRARSGPRSKVGIRVPFVLSLERQAPGGQGLLPASDPARRPARPHWPRRE